jgi:MarR family 2-MHQ and catechol resistance regulon transcriptional repressor
MERYDQETGRALRLFVILSRCFDSVSEHARRDIARYKLSISEFGTLELLYHKGPQPLGEIAERILLTTGSVTYVMDQLEKRGLAQRVACPTDRRVYYAELTADGRALIQTLFPEHAECLRQAVAGLTPEEQETAIQLLKKLGLSAQAALKSNERIFTTT